MCVTLQKKTSIIWILNRKKKHSLLLSRDGNLKKNDFKFLKHFVIWVFKLF